MLPVLFLSHAVLGGFCLFTRMLAPDRRSPLIRAAAGGGALAALLLFFVRGSAQGWRSFSLRPGPAAVVAAAVFCAWLMLLALESGAGRWDLGALVGAGASALALFASSDWIAPALLFWVCLSISLWLTTSSAGQSGVAATVLALSDALFVGALVVYGLDRETWQMPSSVASWPGYLLVAAALLRAGILPRLGIWSLLGRIEGVVVPLAVGSAFALVPIVSEGDEILVALPVLCVGVATAVWVVVDRAARLASVAAWASALMASVVWIEPRSLGKAGVSAVIAVTVTAMWPWTSGRAQSERGLLLAAVPATVGFGAVVAGAAASFERAISIETVLASAPWSAFAALLPAALAAGVTVGAGIARRLEPESYEPAAVLATWALAGAGLLLGLSPSVQLGFSSGAGAAGGAPWLYLVAVGAGVATARFGPRRNEQLETILDAPSAGAIEATGTPAKRLERAAAGVTVATFGLTLWFTYRGLSIGFL